MEAVCEHQQLKFIEEGARSIGMDELARSIVMDELARNRMHPGRLQY